MFFFTQPVAPRRFNPSNRPLVWRATVRPRLLIRMWICELGLGTVCTDRALLEPKSVFRSEGNRVFSTQTSVLRHLSDCPDPLYRGLPIRFQTRFAPLGKIVQVESNEAAVIEAGHQSFGRYNEPATAGEPGSICSILSVGIPTSRSPT
jgi:hypothetical protein